MHVDSQVVRGAARASVASRDPTPSPNFAYLDHHDPRLAALGTQAEQHFEADPTITLWKLRQFSEVLAQRAAARYGVFQPGEPQAELIERLFARGVIRRSSASSCMICGASGTRRCTRGRGRTRRRSTG